MSGLDDLLDGPPRHLERYAPPWAALRRTICGRPLDDVSAWLSFDEGKALIEKLGQQRARLVLCQTCLNQQRAISTARAWDQNPAQVVQDWTGRGVWPGSPGFDEMRAELLSLARLVDAHRDEYDALVNGFTADEITARRKAKARPSGANPPPNMPPPISFPPRHSPLGAS
jgi:hypothetical protein